MAVRHKVLNTIDIKPIRRVNVSAQVFEQMKSLILSGEWRSGMRLPSENSLADLFGVSRITIRQGIHRLVALGLAQTRSGEGTFICALSHRQSISSLIPIAYLSDDNMLSVLEFRKAIEGYTAELAAKKATADDTAKLEKIFTEMEQNKGNLEGYSEADYNFHYELAVISRNSLIIECYNLTGDLFRTAMKNIVEKRGHSQGLYFHRLIINKIIAKDAEGCRLLMTKHIDDTYADMVSRMDEKAASAKSGQLIFSMETA
ncbi:MAG: FadR family transcriptional regulator [Treponema sp.]|nr:FadR family transcriptional regulator [Treponema sp.]